jgi:hypothetical protein
MASLHYVVCTYMNMFNYIFINIYKYVWIFIYIYEYMCKLINICMHLKVFTMKASKGLKPNTWTLRRKMCTSFLIILRKWSRYVRGLIFCINSMDWKGSSKGSLRYKVKRDMYRVKSISRVLWTTLAASTSASSSNSTSNRKRLCTATITCRYEYSYYLTTGSQFGQIVHGRKPCMN